jgi:hypothetical protein
LIASHVSPLLFSSISRDKSIRNMEILGGWHKV